MRSYYETPLPPRFVRLEDLKAPTIVARLPPRLSDEEDEDIVAEGMLISMACDRVSGQSLLPRMPVD